MKVKRINEEKFNPVTISITLETKDELAAFYSAFNYTPLTAVLRKYGIEAELIREEFDCVEYKHVWSDFVKELESMK